MLYYEFTFRSLTTSQLGRNVLLSAGIDAELLRASASVSGRGCAYVLRVSGASGVRAANVLHSSGIFYSHSYRIFPGGIPEEVVL